MVDTPEEDFDKARDVCDDCGRLKVYHFHGDGCDTFARAHGTEEAEEEAA
jgi:hypothetical protein